MYLPHATTLPGQEYLPLAARGEDCGFEGNSDLYGLGIRLGLYMQWLSSFALRIDSQSYGLLLKTHFTFIFAIFVAILVLTAEKRPTYKVEIHLLTHIMFGGTYIILMPRQRKKSKAVNDEKSIAFSLVSLSAFLCLFNAVAFYCFWFWLRGVHSDNFLATPCGSHAFLFAKLSLSNRAVTNGLAAVSGLLSFSLIFSIITLALNVMFNKGELSEEPTRPQPDATEEENREADDERLGVREIFENLGGREVIENHIKNMTLYRIYIKASIMIYFLLAIELTLYWNGVTDVYSVGTAGQLIPLIIGLCGLVQFLYKPPLRRFMEWKNMSCGACGSRHVTYRCRAMRRYWWLRKMG